MQVIQYASHLLEETDRLVMNQSYFLSEFIDRRYKSTFCAFKKSLATFLFNRTPIPSEVI